MIEDDKNVVVGVIRIFQIFLYKADLQDYID